MSKLAAALELAEENIPVFPCRGKTPLTTHGFKDATTDTDQISRWWRKWPTANIGVPTGAASGHVAIDADTYKPEYDPAALDALDLPPTQQHSTPQGGVQYIWLHDGEPIPNDNSGKLGPAIDFRGDGGYTIWPPSTGYRRLNDLEPDWLPDNAAVRLNGAGPASPPAGAVPKRHDTLRTASVKLAAAGFDPVDALTMLTALDAASPNPIAKEGRADEIRRLAESAEKYAPEETFEHDVAQEARMIRRRRRAKAVVDAEELRNPLMPANARTVREELAIADQEPDWLIRDLAERDMNVDIVAREKSGKTTLGVNLLAALQGKTPFLAYFDVDPRGGKVMYINFQMSDRQFRRWLRQRGLAPNDDVIVVNARGKSLPLWMEEVGEQWAAYCREHDVRVVIIDTASDAWRGLVANSNDNTQVGVFTGALDLWKASAGVETLFLLHHMSKSEQEEDEETGLGAIGLEAWADAIWILTMGKKDDDAPDDDGPRPRWLRARGRDVDQPAVALKWDPGTLTMTTTGATRDEQRVEVGVRKIVRILLVEDELETKELEKRYGVKRSFPYARRDAEMAGLIERRYQDGSIAGDERSGGKSKFCCLTDAGRAAAGRWGMTGERIRAEGVDHG
jgi:hypothetical protein